MSVRYINVLHSATRISNLIHHHIRYLVLVVVIVHHMIRKVIMTVTTCSARSLRNLYFVILTAA